MPVTEKIVDLTNSDKTQQEWLNETKNVWINMLNGVWFNEQDKKYHFVAPILSDVSLEGEKIKPRSNQEFTVVFSCLYEEFQNNAEVKRKWWEAAEQVKQAYIEQKKIQAHIESNNTDLKRLRKEGTLEDKEDLAKEYKTDGE